MTSFVALVPVKASPSAKSRFGDLAEDVRRDLARAFALDVVAALALCPEVARTVVVTDDQVLRAGLSEAGVDLAADADSLNAALLATADSLAASWPGAQPLALLADLPCLTAPDLSTVLARVEGAAYVADADGTGTTLYTAPWASFEPRFGADSARRHGEIADAVVAPVGVRRDVDDPAALQAARELGVGIATGQALDRHGL